MVRENLLWAQAQGDLPLELIVRHVLLPGHIDCCWNPIARWISAQLPDVKVSLRASFWPAGACALSLELGRTISVQEKELAWDIARAHHLRLID